MRRQKKRLEDLQHSIDDLEKKYADLDDIWKSEKSILQGTTHIKEALEQAKMEMEAARRSGDLAQMSELQYGRIPDLEKQLTQVNHSEPVETRLVRNKVTEEEIAEVVSKWTGIPVSKMLEGEREKLLNMENALHQRLIGQDEAINVVSNAIRRSRAGSF